MLWLAVACKEQQTKTFTKQNISCFLFSASRMKSDRLASLKIKINNNNNVKKRYCKQNEINRCGEGDAEMQ